MIEWIVVFSLVSGSLLMLIVSKGVLKLSDVYMRIHATTKATSLGVVLMLCAVVLWHFGIALLIMSVLLVVSVVLTASIAAHVARTAHAMKVPKGGKYVVDEYQDMKDKLKSEKGTE